MVQSNHALIFLKLTAKNACQVFLCNKKKRKQRSLFKFAFWLDILQLSFPRCILQHNNHLCLLKHWKYEPLNPVKLSTKSGGVTLCLMNSYFHRFYFVCVKSEIKSIQMVLVCIWKWQINFIHVFIGHFHSSCPTLDNKKANSIIKQVKTIFKNASNVLIISTSGRKVL